MPILGEPLNLDWGFREAFGASDRHAKKIGNLGSIRGNMDGAWFEKATPGSSPRNALPIQGENWGKGEKGGGTGKSVEARNLGHFKRAPLCKRGKGIRPEAATRGIQSQRLA